MSLYHSAFQVHPCCHTAEPRALLWRMRYCITITRHWPSIQTPIHRHAGCARIWLWRIRYEHGCANIRLLCCVRFSGARTYRSPHIYKAIRVPPPQHLLLSMLSLLIRLLGHSEGRWENLVQLAELGATEEASGLHSESEHRGWDQDQQGKERRGCAPDSVTQMGCPPQEPASAVIPWDLALPLPIPCQVMMDEENQKARRRKSAEAAFCCKGHQSGGWYPEAADEDRAEADMYDQGTGAHLCLSGCVLRPPSSYTILMLPLQPRSAWLLTLRSECKTPVL